MVLGGVPKKEKGLQESRPILSVSIPSPIRNNSGAPEAGHLTPDGSRLSALSATPAHNLGTHPPNIYLSNLGTTPSFKNCEKRIAVAKPI